uniref:Leucine rich repeat containing G protein-coupled receptor 6 n=1 Tax=Astyanax mexicanus TaxID=7994 RepID=A0A3B1J265_ASTMX
MLLRVLVLVALVVRGVRGMCSCVEDGLLLMVDCSELGLSAVPADLSPFTSYLDLSMNNISEIQPNTFQNLVTGPDNGGKFRSLKLIPVEFVLCQKMLCGTQEDCKGLGGRLDANLIDEVPAQTFSRMRSLRHLSSRTCPLTHCPLTHLFLSRTCPHAPVLSRTCPLTPPVLSHLHLHNNQIRTLGQNSFEGLRSLETLELNFNTLQEFPVAIRTLAKLQELGFHNNNIKAIPERAFVGNPLLQTIHFYENPIQFVGRSAFQFLPKLHTLSLNGATEIREFPDLKGTTSLQKYLLYPVTVALKITFILCVCVCVFVCCRELSHNVIEELPSFQCCYSLQEIGLQHNLIRRVDINTFQQLSALRSLDLSWNQIESIHPDAFRSLQSLNKLDLTENQLSVLPLVGLVSLTHLKLRGNSALSTSFRHEDFPNIRVIEMPHAYQCCVFGVCGGYRTSGQWEELVGSEEDEVQKRTLALFPVHTDYDPDLEEFQLAIEDAKLQTSIQCTPVPGPFKPCENLFDSWVVRLGMWLIALVSLLGNGLLILTVFASPSYLSPVKFIIGAISSANLLTGLCSGTLTVVDAMTFGEFAIYGARWETGLGCRATGFVSVLASEASILLLTLAAVQCSVSVSCVRAYGKSPSHGSVRIAAFFCLILSLGAASLPAIGVGEYGTTPLCLPSPLPEAQPSTLGFMVALIMMNSLCFLLITTTYIKLYWGLMKGNFDSVWDCAMIKHIAWLIFTNCILYCPVAFLTFSSLMGLFPVSEEVVKSVLLVLLPLPACINPLLYLLFNPHFREDARLLLNRARLVQDQSLDSFASEDTEKSSYDSTQALVSLTSETDVMLEGLEPSSRHSVPVIPCQLQTTSSTGTRNGSIKENAVRMMMTTTTSGSSEEHKQHDVKSKTLDVQRRSIFFPGVYHSSCHV